MRSGFTTGSAATAASAAAAYMLLFHRKIEQITILTPGGISYTPKIQDTVIGEHFASCGVRKDSGDDPDITNGTMIYSKVSIESVGEVSANAEDSCTVTIDGGIGIGRVTKPGLDQPVGNAAINRVPREMITKEVLRICREADFNGVITVEISCPEGEALAEKTFNPRLGIVGGISIIGTTGIVEPMSMAAIKETIRVELRQKRMEGQEIAAITPGNYGRDYMLRTYGYDIDRSVKCSNFIGDTLEMARELGCEKVLLTGHIGKLIKVSGGMMNTHSSEGDCRMELLSAAAIKAGADLSCVRAILSSVTTEEGIRILTEAGICRETMDIVMDRVMYYLKKKADPLQVECIIYANDFGELARSRRAEEWLTLLAQEQAQ